METIGFIGLGIMGKPMAKNVIRAGYRLVVYDIRPAPMEELKQSGAEAVSSPREVADACEIIILMLPNGPEVKEVLVGDNGILKTSRRGGIVIDMSSISPLVSQEMYAACREKDIRFMDAPVSGGEPKAVDGTLAIMVGGDKDDFNRYEPLLRTMGGSVVHTGKVGSGNTTKLANQVIVALNIAAVSEAFTLATKAGVDPKLVFDAIKGGLAGSTVMNAKVPLMLDRNFKPGFKIDLHIKDLTNALDTAHSIGVPLPLSGVVMEIMQALRVDGKGQNDHGGIVQFYEKLAQIEVG